MATITTIKQRIEQLDAGSFQLLCDAYLTKEGYPNLVALGTRAGTTKTTPGTPDTYFCSIGGKYVFAEYTTQQTGLSNKIREDLEKCFDVQKTGVPTDQISEIVYCHSSSNLSPKDDLTLKQYCTDNGVELRLIGIDFLSEELYQKYPVIVKEHLGLTYDTEQIRSLPDFVQHYDSNDLAAPLNTVFQYRQHEIDLIDSAFERHDVVVLTGVAGVGKTRLALKYADDYCIKNGYQLFVIHNHGLPIFEDLKFYFEKPGKYFIVIDDANQISQLPLITEYVNKKGSGYHTKIIITVRSYALEKIRKELKANVRFEEAVIGAFSDDEIKSIVSNHYGIQNYLYLDRIARIAEGNARIAILAGKIASDANRLDSINDASQLYEEFFGKVFQESHLEEDIQLQITAGVIAFLNTVHLDYLTPVLTVLSDSGLDTCALKSCIYKLHELELVNVCHDKAVAISDQCFANFILKYVFFDKKSISLSAMIDACFEPFREKTMQAINTLLGVYRSQEMHDFVANEINIIWSRKKEADAADFWEWIKAFYPVNPEETLLLIRERVEQADKVIIPVNSIDTDKYKNYQHIDDEIISILGGFANTENLDAALDLFFAYYLKRPDLFMEFYHSINQYYGIDSNAVQNDFYTPIHLINHFTLCSDQWRNEYIRLLFFSVIGEFLKVHFTSHEVSRKANSISICNFSLKPSKSVFSYREKIWSQIIAIQEKHGCKPEIRSLLNNYNGTVEECSLEIIMKDAPFIDMLLETEFSENDLNDCMLAEHVFSIFTQINYNSIIIPRFLNSEKLKKYRVLVGPEWELNSNYQKWEAEKEQIITDYLSKAKDATKAFDNLYEIYSECVSGRVQGAWGFGSGMQRAVKYMLEEEKNCKYVAEKLIHAPKLDGLYLLDVINKMFSCCAVEEVFALVNSAPTDTKDYWIFAFYHEYPKTQVSSETVSKFYEYLKCDYDRDLQIDRSRELKFLSHYKKYDLDVFIKSVRLIFSKRHYAPKIVTNYLVLFFNEYYCEASLVLELFKQDMTLLEDIYVFESKYDIHLDFDGHMLKALCDNNEAFIEKYYINVYAANRYHRHEESRRLQAIYTCKNYFTVIDIIVDDCANQGRFVYYDLASLMKIFVAVPQNLIEKSNLWVQHYITDQNKNVEKMQALFEAIAESADPDRRISFIKSLVSVNNDAELFSKIDLIPCHYMVSESTVPLYSGWINYLEKLRTLFHGLTFIKHKLIIDNEIKRLKALIEQSEIEDVLHN